MPAAGFAYPLALPSIVWNFGKPKTAIIKCKLIKLEQDNADN
jgi:hypothetical protein